MAHTKDKQTAQKTTKEDESGTITSKESSASAKKQREAKKRSDEAESKSLRKLLEKAKEKQHKEQQEAKEKRKAKEGRDNPPPNGDSGKPRVGAASKRPGARGHAAAKVMVYSNTKFVSRDSAPVGRDTNARSKKSIVN